MPHTCKVAAVLIAVMSIIETISKTWSKSTIRGLQCPRAENVLPIQGLIDPKELIHIPDTNWLYLTNWGISIFGYLRVKMYEHTS